MLGFCFRCGVFGPVVYVDLGSRCFEILCSECRKSAKPDQVQEREQVQEGE